MPPPAYLLATARRLAAASSLDPALVCAIIEQESSWNAWAIRYEPAFFSKYVAPLFTNNKINASEAWARGYSWGLMQVMGQVARENAFTPQEHPFLSELCDPEQGIAVGCRVLLKKFAQAGRDFRFTPPSFYSKASANPTGASATAPSSGAPRSGAQSKNPPPSSSSSSSSSSGSSPGQSSSDAQVSPSSPSASNFSIALATPTDLALITRALLLWNGGANSDYPRQVLARLPHYA